MQGTIWSSGILVILYFLIQNYTAVFISEDFIELYLQNNLYTILFDSTLNKNMLNKTSLIYILIFY